MSQTAQNKSNHKSSGDAKEPRNRQDGRDEQDGRSTDLRESPMMAHLMDALQKGTDIGHYGRLTFTMIARHFLDEEQVVKLLQKQPDMDEEQARALLAQVTARDYNPPRRERILEWQAQQEFPICPTPDDPGSCNVYSELRFPDGIYENINEFYEEQASAQEGSRA